MVATHIVPKEMTTGLESRKTLRCASGILLSTVRKACSTAGQDARRGKVLRFNQSRIREVGSVVWGSG